MATSSDKNGNSTRTGSIDTSNLNIVSDTGRKLSQKNFLDDITAEQRAKDYSNRFKETANFRIDELRDYIKELEKLPKLTSRQKDLITEMNNEIDSFTKDLQSGELTTSQMFQHSEIQMKKIAAAIDIITKAKLKQIEANNKLSASEKEMLTQAAKANAKNIKDQLVNEKKLNTEMKEALNVLNSSTTRLGKLADSFGNVGKKFSELSNTLNLQKLAGTSQLFGASDKASIMNNLQMQFGISGGQFETFKNDVISNIQDTNNAIGKSLFGSNDMKTYLNKIQQYGITNLEIAKQQASASITATKYLGVSDETQSKIFTFMRRTNDYTMLDKHNKTIVGLLNAQLGVSREQLDTMTQTALDTANTLYDMGYSQDQIDRLTQDQTIMGAALTSASGNANAGDIWTSFMNKSLTTTASNAGVFAPLVQQMQSAFDQGASQQDMLRILQNNPFINNMMNIMQNGNMQQRTEARETFMSAGFDERIITLLTDLEDKQGNISSAYQKASLEVNNTDDNRLNATLNSIKTTFAETFLNRASLAFDKLPWGTYMNLANAAFALYIAEGGLKIINGISKLFTKGGGLSGLFMKFLGKGSAVEKAATSAASSATTAASTGGSMLATLGPIAAGVGVIAAAWGIAKGVIKAHDKRSEQNASDIQSQEGTTATVSSEFGSARDLSSDMSTQKGAGHWMTNEAGSLFNGVPAIGMFIGRGINSVFSKTNDNYVKDNKTLIDWYFNTSSGKYTEDQLRGQQLAFAYMLDSINSLESMNFTKQDLKDQIKNGNFERYSVQPWATALYNAGYKVEDRYREKASPNIDVASYGIGGAGNNFVNRSYYSGYGIGGASYPWPVTAGWPNYPEDFGGGRHTGIDFGIPQGTPIGSAESGTVITSNDGWNGGYGNYTIVKGDSGKYYLYAHMSQRKTNVGDKLNKGNLIGLSGTTGNSTGPHLHFEVRNADYYGSDISPYPYINNGLFNASGTATTLTRGQNSEDTAKVPTKKFAVNASILKNAGGPTLNADDMKVVEAVNNGFSALMRQIDNLSRRQDTQQQILESFSRSQNRDLSLGEVVY